MLEAILLGFLVEQTDSRKLISESMILFGSTIANFCRVNNIDVPYRVQNGLNENNYKVFSIKMGKFKIFLKGCMKDL